MTLGNRLKERRAALNVNQQEMGRMAGVSRQTISLIERGDYSPSVTLALTGSWGSSKYMQTYYGVSAAQSAASGFARHDAGSGIYAYSLNLDWTHKLTSRWSLLAAAGVTQLTGEAGDSPIVQRKTSPVGSLKVTYSF